MSGEFVETAALMAALDGDRDELRDRIEAMLPNERRALLEACQRVIGAIDRSLL